jgi:uncharacterized protein YecT (DUF1311 family)
MRAAAVIIVLLITAAAAAAPSTRQAADDSKAIQDCIKAATPPGKPIAAAARCVGILADPCLDDEKTKSTADQNACIEREQAVWDDILNESYRRLRAKLDADQQVKLRDMQRAWIASRDATCHFYWDYYQGTMASPMGAYCMDRETARRALFLLDFTLDDDKK